jgi:hypothetical protein
VPVKCDRTKASDKHTHIKIPIETPIRKEKKRKEKKRKEREEKSNQQSTTHRIEIRSDSCDSL